MKPLKHTSLHRLALSCLQDLSGLDQAFIRDTYNTAIDTDLFEVSARTKITSIVAHALIQSVGSLETPRHWYEAHQRSESRTHAFLSELDRIGAILNKHNLPVILVENGAIARFFYECKGCFSFGDLDLIVQKEHLSLINNILLQEGYKPAFGKDMTELPNSRAEYKIRLDNKYDFRLNLQMSFVSRRWFKNSSEPALDSLIIHSIRPEHSDILILNPEYNLLQLIMHSAAHCYVRKPGIQLHLDIDRFVRRVEINWLDFCNLVGSYSLRTAAYYSLLFPHIIFETPIPSYVMNAFRPYSLKENLLSSILRKPLSLIDRHGTLNLLSLTMVTLLLHDTVKEAWRAVFPDREWMIQHYRIKLPFLLPYYHMRRFGELLASRGKQ